jgi:formylglycine-generating enzyme required for sulfatase activity
MLMVAEAMFMCACLGCAKAGHQCDSPDGEREGVVAPDTGLEYESETSIDGALDQRYGDCPVCPEAEQCSNGMCVPDGMVGVPGGEFWMGCDESIDAVCKDWKLVLAQEWPGRLVFVSGFAIDRLEVTMVDYLSCVDAGQCPPRFHRILPGDPWPATCSEEIYWGPDNANICLPATCVTWDGAVAYCSHQGKRLCTEAEWEKAARGTDHRVFPWGNEQADCSHAVSFGCGKLKCVGATPAGASPYGAQDMAGNAAELVADWYHDTYYEWGSNHDPQGPPAGELRVLRGGSFEAPAKYIRTSTRGWASPEDGQWDNGFRCCVSL